MHKYIAGNWIAITLAAVTRQPNKDYPKVYWYDEFMEEIDKNYQIGDRVEMICRLRTSRANPEQILMGTSIETLSGWIDARFNADEYGADQNEVLLKSKFVRAYIPGPD